MAGRRMQTGGEILVGGYVRPYGGAYQGETGDQMGDRETDQVWHVQHPERPKRGSGIGTLRDGAGTDELWCFPGNESHKRSLHAGS